MIFWLVDSKAGKDKVLILGDIHVNKKLLASVSPIAKQLAWILEELLERSQGGLVRRLVTNRLPRDGKKSIRGCRLRKLRLMNEIGRASGRDRVQGVAA